MEKTFKVVRMSAKLATLGRIIGEGFALDVIWEDFEDMTGIHLEPGETKEFKIVSVDKEHDNEDYRFTQ